MSTEKPGPDSRKIHDAGRLARLAAERLVDWLPALTGQEGAPENLSGRRGTNWSQAEEMWRRLTAGDGQGVRTAGQNATQTWNPLEHRRRGTEDRRDALKELTRPVKALLQRDDVLRHHVRNELDHPLPLTVYVLEPGFLDLEDPLKETDKPLRIHQLHPEVQRDLAGDDSDFDARLYVVPAHPLAPAWLPFLQQGFDNLEVGESASNQLLLVMRVTGADGTRRVFAFPFGMGHLLLAKDHCERLFGLKAALNAIYGPSRPRGDRGLYLRSLDWTTFARTTFRTRRQAGALSRFDEFGVDMARDLLAGATGQPADPVAWGNRIGGSDAVRLGQPEHFYDLPDLCRRLLRLRQESTYGERFPWIDYMTPVTNEDLVAILEARILDDLRFGNPPRAVLGPPELLDFERISGFSIEIVTGLPDPIHGPVRKTLVEEPSLEEYFSLLAPGGRRQMHLDILKQCVRIHALDGNEEAIGSWPLWSWLETETVHGGTTYVLSGGRLWEIEQEYRREIDSFVEGLEAWDRYELPPAASGQHEADYNSLAAKRSGGHLLCMDAKTVRSSTNPDPVELCDLLSDEGELIHVKRKLGSSQLSHLFSQGSVSGELLLDSEFRAAALKRVQGEQGGSPTDFTEKLLSADGRNGDRVVVYGVVASWRDRTPVEALPFFSRVNLRTHARRLHKLGYRVYFNAIQEVAPAAVVTGPRAAAHRGRPPRKERASAQAATTGSKTEATAAPDADQQAKEDTPVGAGRSTGP